MGFVFPADGRGGTIVAMNREQSRLQQVTHGTAVRRERPGANVCHAFIGSRTVGLVFSLLLLLAPASSSAQASDRDQIQLHYQRAQEAIKANDLQEASNEFREILKIDPRNAEAYANLGQIAYGQRKYGEAAKEFGEALSVKPQLWDAKAFLGLSDMMLGRTGEGDPLLMEAFPHITNQNLKVEAGISLVRLHMATHSLDQVVGVVHGLEQSGRENPEVLYVAYRAYSALAEEALGTLYKKWPDSARVHQIFAQADVTQDDFPAAIKQYKLAIAADPNLPGIHYELGRTILANSQDNAALNEAEQEFQTELKANPWDADSEFELGEVYRLKSESEAAREHYLRALQLNPNSGSAQTALGELLLNSGKSEEALPHLEAGARLSPDDETSHYELSRAYAALGRRVDAKREMDIFLRLKREHGLSHAQPPPDENGNGTK